MNHKKRLYLSGISILTLIIIGLIFQSFKIEDKPSSSIKAVEYDEVVETTYSFPGDSKKIDQIDLAKSQARNENRHVRAEVLPDYQIVITSTMQERPMAETDSEPLVAKVIRSNDGVEMYNFDGEKIESPTPIDHKNTPQMQITEDQVEFFGVFRTPKIPSEEELVKISKAGKKYTVIDQDKYSITDERMEIIIDPTELSVAYLPKGKNKPFDSSITYFTSIGEGKSLRKMTVTQSTEILPSGQQKVMTVTSTFKNHQIFERGELVHGIKKP